MRILITTSVDPRHSAHGRIHEFIDYLSSKNHVHVISVRDCWKEEQPAARVYEEEFESILNQVEFSYLTNKESSMAIQELKSRKTIRRILRESRIDYDVILDYNTILIGRNASKEMTGVPRIVDLADDIVHMVRTSPRLPLVLAAPSAWYSRYAINRSIQDSTLVTGITESLLELYGVPKAKRRVIPNGVHSSFFSTEENEDSQASSERVNGITIGYVGVLREWVDLKPVFDAMKMLYNELHIRFVILGEEGNSKSAKKLVERYGLASRVSWAGTIPHKEIREYVKKWDCGIIPFAHSRTTHNALPLKLFEYFACGLPVISTKVSGIVEGFSKEVAFYDTAEELAELLTTYIGTEEARAMGMRGRKRCETHFTWEAILPEFYSLLGNLVNGENESPGGIRD